MTSTSPSRRVGGLEDVSEVYERYGKPDLLTSAVRMLAGLGTLVSSAHSSRPGPEASTISSTSSKRRELSMKYQRLGDWVGEAYDARVDAALIDAVRKED